MVSNCPCSMCDHFRIMTLGRAAPVSANEVPANSWSAVLDVGYSGVKEQFVLQYIFLLMFTWRPSLDLISVTIGKTFCHYHISPSDGWSVYPRELNPVGEPIMKYVSHHVSSIQFSCSIVSNSLRPREPQHARPPCPSPTPRVHPNSCPLSQWCHPAISSSVVPFSRLQYFPSIRVFLNESALRIM